MHHSTAGDHATLGILVRDDHDLTVVHREHRGHEHHTPDHEHPHEHPHGHEHHADEHRPHPHAPHDHDHDHAHEAAAPSRRGLVAMGLAGGLLPSPSALIVFLGALAVGRPWFGVALVVAFGIGMAVTLATVGLLVMRLRERAERRLGARPHSRLTPLLRAVPLLTAATVVVLGAALALRGLTATGIV